MGLILFVAAEEVVEMSRRPEWLKMPAVDDSPVEREIMLVIRLREYVAIGLTGNIDGLLIGLRQFAIRKGKVLAGSSNLGFDDLFAGHDLVGQCIGASTVDHIVVHGMRSDKVPSFREFVQMLPSHGSSAMGHYDVLVEMLDVLLISIHVIGIDKEHGIDTELFEDGRKDLIAFHEAVVKGKGN